MTRIIVSVERYHLNFNKLALHRKTIWETCIALVHEIQHLMQEQVKSPGAAKKACIEEKRMSSCVMGGVGIITENW